MSMASVPSFYLTNQDDSRIMLRSVEGYIVHIFVLEEDIFRVMVLPGGKPRFARTWAIAPGQEDVPLEGRDRFNLEGFTSPAVEILQEANQLRIATARVRLTIRLQGFFCQWELMHDGRWQLAVSDRSTQSYNFGWWDERVYHYLKRETDEMYFGLGERAGNTNRMGQSYRMTNIDAMGYNARTTDPLYKHIPFYLTWKQQSNRHSVFFTIQSLIARSIWGVSWTTTMVFIAISSLTMEIWTTISSGEQR
jgi:alpha-glucosidase